MVASDFYEQNSDGECRCTFPDCAWQAKADIHDGLDLATSFFRIHFASAHEADLAIAMRLRALVSI